MIFLEPTGGLCNRILALDAGIALARRLRCSLRLVWRRKWDFNCPWHELFVTPPEVRGIINSRVFYGVAWRLQRAIPDAVPGVYRQFTDHNIDGLAHPLAECVERWPLSLRYPLLLIATCRWFARTGPGFEWLVVPPPIASTVESLTCRFERPTIGVHMRRGDHYEAAEMSPTPAFIRLMHEAVDANPATQFFLCTDSPPDEARLIAEFPGRLIIWKKRSLDYNEPVHNHDAMIDMLALSKTQRIIGSYNSSFSSVASLRGGIPLHVATAADVFSSPPQHPRPRPVPAA